VTKLSNYLTTIDSTMMVGQYWLSIDARPATKAARAHFFEGSH
jgi:hypothetical protein